MPSLDDPSVCAWALRVVVPYGKNRGRTLGQVFVEWPGWLRWASRCFRDGVVRAACRVILETAARAA